jgi:hypothetical protein
MRAHRLAACSVAAVALSIPVAASALPAGSSVAHAAASSARPATTLLRKHVRSAGTYDVKVTVRSRVDSLVRLRIGTVSRRAWIRGRAHRTSLRLRLQIRRHLLTIRATGTRSRPRLTVRLVDVSTRGTSGPAKPTTHGSTPKTRADGPTGATGATAANGSGSNGTQANGPQSGTPPQAPTAPAGAWDGPFWLPNGFAPVTDYTNLVRDYEFTGSSLPADWSAGTNNMGFQATEFEPSQVSMTGSSVALTANNQTSPNGSPYESGWISTVNTFSFQYGMVDFRAEMPGGQGLWSGLWMVNPAGTSPDTEIDVAEMLLGDTHTVYGSLHNWGPSPYWAEIQGGFQNADQTTGFHDYQVIWQPGMVTWAVDGIAYAQYTEQEAVAAGHTWPFDGGNGVYLIADLAVGGASDWGGPPNSATTFPAAMQIQSVKVWQQ